MMKQTGCLFGMCLIFISSLTQAATTTDIKQQGVLEAVVTKTQLAAIAKQWGITVKDYRHYQYLMKSTPSGKWYQQLDPAEVLALNVDSESEMMHYAKLEARMTHDKVSKELTFNRLYRQAYQLLYPDQLPIEASVEQPTQKAITRLQKGDHLWLFTRLTSIQNDWLVPILINRVMETPGSVLDIYIVGHPLSDEAIRRWAATHHISPALVMQKRVSLNEGNHRFTALAKGKKFTLPLMGVLHQGQFHSLKLSDGA